MHQKNKKLVGVSLFTAIVVVLQFLGGGIKFAAFSITLVLVPIVVGAAVYGWKAGAFLGFVFGGAVLISGDAAAFLAVNPIGTVCVVLLKGMLCGLCSGLVYLGFEKINRFISVISAAIICPIVNTGVFLIGCKLFFMPTITEWAIGLGFKDAGSYMIFGLVGINFLIELGVNIILSPVIVRIINYRKK